MANHTCPVWVGYMLLNPIRKLIENPDKIFKPHVKEGMTVLDAGSAMGFFSLPLAKMVTKKGKVICVDLQQKMLDSLVRRANKAGVGESIKTILASEDSLNIQPFKGSVDIALAFHIVHEVNNQNSFFADISDALKSGGKLLFAEPAGHVSKNDFNKSLSIAENTGLKINQTMVRLRSLSALLEKI